MTGLLMAQRLLLVDEAITCGQTSPVGNLPGRRLRTPLLGVNPEERKRHRSGAETIAEPATITTHRRHT